MNELDAFLHDIFALESGEYIEVRPYFNGRMVYDKWAFYDDINSLVSSGLTDETEYDVFFGIASRKISSENLVTYGKVRCLAFDVDRLNAKQYKTIIEDFRKLNLLPNYVISSGSGLHCYLLITPTSDMDRVIRVSLKISELIDADCRVIRKSQFMRLPGTYNNGKKVEFLYKNRTFISSIEDIETIVNLDSIMRLVRR